MSKKVKTPFHHLAAWHESNSKYLLDYSGHHVIEDLDTSDIEHLLRSAQDLQAFNLQAST